MRFLLKAATLLDRIAAAILTTAAATLPEDTFGISKILPDYVVEMTVHRVGQSSTKMEISHYYSSTPTLKAKLLNLIARRRIARDTQATLNGTIVHRRRY